MRGLKILALNSSSSWTLRWCRGALIRGAELLVTASYYGSVVLSKLSPAPNLWAGAVRTELSTRLLSVPAALPSVLFIAPASAHTNSTVTSSPCSQYTQRQGQDSGYPFTQTPGLNTSMPWKKPPSEPLFPRRNLQPCFNQEAMR